MTTDAIPFKKNHHGRNIRRLREMLGVKQEAIAIELEMTQQNFSVLEQKEEIDDVVLDKIALALKVPVNAIKNMNEEATINYINTFHDNSGSGQNSFSTNTNSTLTFNPLDKIVDLYERLVKKKEDQVAFLEQFIKDKK